MFKELVDNLSQITQTNLSGPASGQEIAALQSRFATVPPELVELLSYANGEVDSNFKSNGMIAFEAFISSEHIIREFDFATSYDVYHDLNQFITCDRIQRTENWHEGLIPISFGYDAHRVCIDMRPGPGGCVGQILALRPVTGNIYVIANDLRQLLERTIAMYKARDFDPSSNTAPCLTLEDFPPIHENGG